MYPVAKRRGTVGEAVRLRPPRDWGYPSLADPTLVPAQGVAFTVTLAGGPGPVVIQWQPFMSEFARDARRGLVIGHHHDALTVVQFDDKPELLSWQCLAHPDWLDYLGFDAGNLGPECACPTAQLMTLGCTCGRAFRERAARLQQERDRR